MTARAISGWALATALLATPALAQASADAGARPDEQPAAAQATNSADVIVTGRRADGYRAIDSDALGLNLDLQQTPATVNVITETFLRDVGAHKLADIIAYTPGVVNNETAGSQGDYFIVRGFATSFTYLNGVRQAYFDQRRGLATIQRVEVLKGPAGAESGVADPGGTVNIITKKPLSTFAAEFDAAVGDYHYRYLTADVTGPVALDGKLQARLIGGYQRDPVWRPGQRDNQFFVTVAPSVKLDYLPGGSLTLEYEHAYNKGYYDRGVIYLPGFYKDGFGPRDTSTVHSKLNYSRVANDREEVHLDQKLASFLTLSLAFQNSDQHQTGRSLDAEAGAGDLYADDGLTWNGLGHTIPFFYSDGPNPSRSQTYAASLTGDFTVAGIRNTVVVGYEHSNNVQYDFYVNTPVANVLDLYAPDNDQRPIFNGPTDTIYFRGEEDIDSAYVKWIARLGDRLRLLGAFRYDDYFLSSIFTVTGANPYDSGLGILKDTLKSYRIATSYDLTRGVTAFAGYANGYQPQSGRSRSGPIPALRARSVEAGVKIALAGGRGLWTNTLYSVRQDNQTIEDPTNDPTLNEDFVVLFGAVRARGFESELTGKVLPGLDLSAGFTVLETKVVANKDGLEGKRFLNVPDLQASAFASYDLAAVGFKPLTLRLGLQALGNREGNVDNTFRLPGYVRVDTGIAYALTDRLTLDLHVENLFDRTYYLAADQGGNGGGTVSVGNRRLVQGSLGYKF